MGNVERSARADNAIYGGSSSGEENGTVRRREGSELQGGNVTERRQDAALKTAALH